MALSPSTASARINDISDIQDGHAGADAGARSGKARIADALKAARNHLDAAMAADLKMVHGVNVRNTSHPVDAYKPDLNAARLQGAQLLLAVDVAGYGRVKRKWVLLMAGSGLIEGIGQGVATASVTGNPLVGAGVGLEEIVSESLTWLGGAWLWNKYLAPVTLEGRLWRVRDGRLVWYNIEFADSTDLMRLMFGGHGRPKEEALTASLQQAENDLFDDLSRYLDRQILFAGKRKQRI